LGIIGFVDRRGKHDFGFLLSPAAGVVLVVGWLVWTWPRRRWLEVSLSGFVIYGWRNKRVFTDDQVTGLAVRSETDEERTVYNIVDLDIARGEDRESIRC